MKICEKCGAHNSDERSFCVDCNEKLGDKLSELQEKRLKNDLSEKIEGLYNKKDPLYVSRSDKIIGVLSLLGVLCSLVLMIIGKITERDFQIMWVGIVFFLLTSIEALMPRVTWELEKMRLSFTINGADDAEPSDFYIYCRKAAIIISAAVGIVILVFNILDFRYPPIRKYISQIAATESVAHSSIAQDYIKANPEKWKKIIKTEDYAVSLFISELKKARETGLEERLMMEAITEINGKTDFVYNNKDDFLFFYNNATIARN